MRKSINKTTVIIVLAIFLTISVGYALFSDTITIEGTATAQGNFDIEATCYTTISDDLVQAYNTYNSELVLDDNGYNNETCTVTDDKVTYSAGFEYPGASKWFIVKFTNVGTIDAIFSDINSFYSLEGATINTYNSQTNELISSVEDSSQGFINGEGNFLFQRNDGTYMDMNNATEEEQGYWFDEVNQTYTLRQGASFYIFYNAGWPKEGYSEDGVYYEAIHTVEFPFAQYNG